MLGLLPRPNLPGWFVVDMFLLLLIGMGLKIALGAVPQSDQRRDMT